MGIETKSKLLPKDENNNLEAPYGNWNSKKDIILSLFSHHLEAPYGNWNTVSIMLVFVVSSIDLEAPYGNWNISVMFSLFVFFSRFRSSLWELKHIVPINIREHKDKFRSSLWELKQQRFGFVFSHKRGFRSSLWELKLVLSISIYTPYP